VKLGGAEVLAAVSPARLRSLKALCVASVVAPAIVFSAYAYITYDSAHRAAEAKALHLVAMLQEHTQRVFETIQLALYHTDRLLAGMPDEIIRNSHDIWSQVKATQLTGPQIGSVFVLGADGSAVLNTRAFPSPPTNFSDRDYFLAQKESDVGLFLGGSYTGKISKAPIFNFSIRRSSGDGRFKGVIGSSAFVDYFQNFYATVGDVEDDFSIVLLRSDGDILARYPDFTVGQKLDLTNLRRDPGVAHQIRYMTSPVDNKSRLYASAKIGNFPAYVTFSIARGAIIREWTRDLAVPAGVGIVITAALLLLTLFALRRAQREGLAIQQLKDVAQSLNEEIQRRQKAETSLLQSQKLDALGRITSGIAHDFNNLLMIISGSLSLAKKQRAGPRLRRLLEACEQATERGAALIRQLLAFSRGQTLRPVAVDVRRVLAEGQTWIGRIVTEAVQIEIACDDAVWPVFVDLTQLESALLNLVVNARDAMAGGGRLTIKVRNVTFAERQTIRPLFGDYVAIAVSDSGSGMSEEVLGRVFEPFFTTKGIGKGTGLGLSQIHGFIQQSEGDISIVSEVGKGTTVTLYLPRSKEMLSSEQTSMQHAASLPLQNEDVVLVVEDDAAVRKTIVEQLYDLAYRPIAVRSVEEARGILSAGGRLDILLTAYTLVGGSNGLELAREAKKQRPELRTLIMTASLDIEQLSGTPLRKPFTQAELQRALAGLSS
jgi:two-component system, NtrC family, sensor kinase